MSFLRSMNRVVKSTFKYQSALRDHTLILAMVLGREKAYIST